MHPITSQASSAKQSARKVELLLDKPVPLPPTINIEEEGAELMITAPVHETLCLGGFDLLASPDSKDISLRIQFDLWDGEIDVFDVKNGEEAEQSLRIYSQGWKHGSPVSGGEYIRIAIGFNKDTKKYWGVSLNNDGTEGPHFAVGLESKPQSKFIRYWVEQCDEKKPVFGSSVMLESNSWEDRVVRGTPALEHFNRPVTPESKGSNRWWWWLIPVGVAVVGIVVYIF